MRDDTPVLPQRFIPVTSTLCAHSLPLNRVRIQSNGRPGARQRRGVLICE